MIEYFIRQLDNKHFQIAKFEDTKEPTETYTVTKTLANNYYHCNCMGFRRNQTQDHKHIAMVMYLEQHGHNYCDENNTGKTVFTD